MPEAVELECQQCAYVWDYTGENPYATCPHCRTSVKTGRDHHDPSGAKERSGGVESSAGGESTGIKEPEIPESDRDIADCPACGESLLHTIPEVREFEQEHGGAACRECEQSVTVVDGQVVLEQ